LPGWGGWYSWWWTSWSWTVNGTAWGWGSYMNPAYNIFSSSSTANINTNHGYVIITKN
jgi:hypothetical protein